MEYDPASPTDEPEDPLPDVDLSSIPLPDIRILPSVQCGDVSTVTTCITDIPLPPTDLKASEIPLPPAPAAVQYAQYLFEQPIPAVPPPPPPPPPVAVDYSEPDSTSVPLKFSLRSSSKGLGQDVSSEPSGVFESSKDLKTSEPRAMPKLQALMKRSKPSKLTVGVLPSKTKLPATETKTELFLPTKESDESNGVTAALEVAASLASTINSSGLQSAASNQTSDPTELLTNAMKEVSVLNSLAHMASTGNVAHITVEASRAELSAHLPSTLPSANNSAAHIPNLMSLTVQPVQPTPQPTALSADPTSVLRQPKMNLANMQFVNPQKLRSAQMIATPLIANPAIAAQPHHSDEQSKSRDSRRRSRSRSRRRSHSGRRSSPNRRSRRHHSSSSGGSTPRHSSRGYQRRSRSRHSSEERYPKPRRQSRGRDWDRRDRDRWREDSFESERRRRSDRSFGERRTASRVSPISRYSERSRRRSDSHDRSWRNRLSRRSPDRDKRADSRDRDRSSRNEADRRRSKPAERKRSLSPSEREDFERKRRKSSSEQRPADKIGQKPKDVKNDRTRVDNHKQEMASSDSEAESSDTSESSSDSHRSKSSGAPVAEKLSPRKSVRPRSVSSKESSDSSSMQDAMKDDCQEADDLPTSEPSPTKSLSTRESELINASLHPRNAGVGSVSPVAPSQQDESDAMDLASDTEVGSVDTASPGPVSNAQLCNGDVFCGGTPEQSASHVNSDADLTGIQHSTVPSEGPPSSLAHEPSSSNTVRLHSTLEPVAPAASLVVGIPQPSPAHSIPGRIEGKYDLRERKTKENRSTVRELDHLLSVMFADLSRSEPSSKVFDSHPEAPKPEYQHIVENDYSRIERINMTAMQNKVDGITKASLLGSTASLTHHEMRRWICDCATPSVEEIRAGIFPCGPGCINRALNIECGPSCPAGEFCHNRQFQKRLYAPTEPFYCGPGKGWGLRTTSPVKRSTFIIEYVGEVIDFAEFRRRIRRYERLGHAHHYFMALESDRFIDAGAKGNWARFVNHSCEPNCVTQKWSVDGEIRIGFFAREDIEAGEEITIDYQFVQFGVSEQKCYCGKPTCSGIMGSTSKTLQDKVRLKDTSVVERRVMQLLQRDSFQRADDITLVLQVMVQECLTRYTRMELLKRLAATHSDACLKLFRQYNGLDMLAAFMCDSHVDDWELKRQILLCLDHIPVSEQKQVQSNSRLMDIVAQWAVDPHYCRPRCTSPGDAQTAHNGSNTAGNRQNGDDAEHSILSEDSRHLVVEMERIGFPAPATPVGNLTMSQQVGEYIPENGSVGGTSPVQLVIGGVFDSYPSTPGSTQSSVLSQVTTQSSSLAASDVRASSNLSSNPSVSEATGEVALGSAYVDVETGEVEPPVLPNSASNSKEIASLPAEAEWIREIRQLALQLIEKWSKLPKENYRIPRTERQETEKELHFLNHTGSSLVSWGHNDETDHSVNSWGQPSNKKFSSSRSRRSAENPSCNLSSLSTEINTHKLTKIERRKLFEAQVCAAASKTDDSTPDPPQPSESGPDNFDEVETLRQLILCSLLEELKKTGPDPSKFGTPGSEEGRTAVLLNTLLQTLPNLLSKLTTTNDISAINRLCQELQKRKADPVNVLPAGWQSAVDPSGRIYYYNMSTKVVQWEKPGCKDGNDHNKLGSTEPSEKSTQPTLSADVRKQMEKDFTQEVGKFILRLLRPYRLPNCMTGRIESNEDLVHVTRKMTHAFVSKELLRCRYTMPPTLTETLQDRIRTSLTRYMTSRGAVYRRGKKAVSTQPAITSVSSKSETPAT
ncbi:Histone-lysine N-methyltransferase setd2 [Clonorchis sinensis]|uniref:[histone H3]-lysine(36) N-trimethyltransferase n=2 Tax=Clonorchis sinensis TaxID=79923 RepID=A0A8T1M378_CLOSI|nr:Histone-lysine N-methyltransferase setd2 [Clonorchis sinensis]